jgi:type IV fimbrial biogenesis protein FimT
VLIRRSRSAGFSMIELMVVISLVAFLSLLTMRVFTGWSADAQVRNTAESLQSALRLAQATAVARNRISLFGLTNGTPTYNSTPAANGSNWFLSLLPLSGSDENAGDSVMWIQGATTARQYNVSINGPALLCFNSLGRLASESTAVTGLASACSNSTSPVTFTISKTGASRDLKVLAYLGGQVRMCDAAKTLSTTNPDGCP